MARPALWRDIHDSLKTDIADGLFGAGDKLPTEAALAARFGVNRHTVRRALAELAEAGLVRSRRGAGVFVTERKIPYPIGKRVRFHQNIAAVGGLPGRRFRTLETRKPRPREAEHLALPQGALVHVCEGVSTVDGQPLVWFRVAFPADRLPGLLEALRDQGSITRALAVCGVPDYTRARTWMTAEEASATLAADLNVPTGAALLRTDAVGVDPAGCPIEYGRSWFVGARVVLSGDF
ncbi:MAG: phosphonate metabolism transcriptional regulator PhnF [Rhodobacterales bacterium]|nr:MAG: phosphonate metabolism transcriptional regulator PhnF [Rhodobacterales bacterium]